jgi:hypothetical protein
VQERKHGVGVPDLWSNNKKMKGERIMNRFTFFLITAFIMAVTAFSSGIGVSYAQQDPAAATPADVKDPVAAKRKADAAVLARAKRDEAIKKRQESKKYIQKVIEGQQSGAAPDNAGKEGTK